MLKETHVAMRLTTPDNVAYIWVKYTGGDTRILHNKHNTFYLEPSKTFKISLWTQDNDLFRNVGVFIGEQRCDGVKRHTAVWCNVETNILFSLPVVSFYDSLKSHCDIALLPNSRPQLSRCACWHSELPFPVTGRWGFPQLKRAEPGWEDVWEMAVAYAIKTVGPITPESLKPIAQLALGFYGYTNLYYPERVDDICGQFESLGTGNDCDDAAVCVGGIASVIMKSNLCDPVAEYIKKNWNMVFVTGGWAKPPGGGDVEGHMWVELFKFNARGCFNRLVVECTAPHPVLKNDLNELEAGSPTDYKPSFRWTHDTQYEQSGNIMKVMQSPIPYPFELKVLEFTPTIPDGWTPPSKAIDAGDIEVKFKSGIEIMPYRSVGVKIQKMAVVDYTL